MGGLTKPVLLIPKSERRVTSPALLPTESDAASFFGFPRTRTAVRNIFKGVTPPVVAAILAFAGFVV